MEPVCLYFSGVSRLLCLSGKDGDVVQAKASLSSFRKNRGEEWAVSRELQTKCKL